MEVKSKKIESKQVSTEESNCVAAKEIMDFFKKKKFKVHIFNCSSSKDS
ncbi:MAG: hypothetical protein HOF38_05230 [Elusimicrobiaceae bacterium]|jgi:hypothetical protein|nr:hypothetical protein [Elusimicrobiaceae bacterium]MBT4008165.1 hypothetical protein [Elusimicrobiaceae bacterium]MBT4402535.1 hypothetical protein [Elusimicrobiaceae bacterium]MBT4439662.1 hypothetical protein [Elusimicrobiaceae bacterium]MBT5988044.1 hypothetical protein [Elusimicrobiaceae bacterium]